LKIKAGKWVVLWEKLVPPGVKGVENGAQLQDKLVGRVQGAGSDGLSENHDIAINQLKEASTK